MILRPTRREDVPRIMEIVAQAQERFRAQGIDQWQDGYPTADVFLRDKAAGNSYVAELDRQVVATVALSFDGEPTYRTICDGA